MQISFAHFSLSDSQTLHRKNEVLILKSGTEVSLLTISCVTLSEKKPLGLNDPHETKQLNGDVQWSSTLGLIWKYTFSDMCMLMDFFGIA